jgi:hypothetical protein
MRGQKSEASQTSVVGQMCGAFRRGATADFSPAFQGRDQIADWSRRVATIEKTSSFRRR